VTLAFDADIGAVEHGYQAAVRDGVEHFLPLVLDLTNPSGGMGWAGEERASLAGRGPADVVMALALVHHLAITNNVPLDSVADVFARLGRAVIVEWVPREDRRVQRLLFNRGHDCERYSLEAFESAFRRLFEHADRQPMAETGRVLHLFSN